MLSAERPVEPHAEPSTGAGPAVWLSALCLALALLALAWVPDTAIVRAKLALGRGLLLASAGLLVLHQLRVGLVRLPWPGVLAACLGPGLLAALHPLHTDPASAGLARDEIARLLLLPLTIWLVGNLAATPRGRSRLMLLLAVAAAGVAAWAVVERLALLPELVAPHKRTRVGFGNPVFLGAWLVLVVPPCLAEGLLRPGPGRWPAALAAGLGIPAVLATDSAGAFVALGVSIVLLVVLLVGRSRTLVLILAGTAAVAATFVLGTRLGHSLLRPRAHDLIWRDTFQMVLEHPGGVGPGQYQLAFLPYASPELLEVYPRESTIVNDAHNEPLQVLAELGWPGLVALLLAAAWLVRASFVALAREHADRHRLAAAGAAVGGALAQSLVSPDLRFSVTFMTLGVLVGLMASFDPAPARWRPGPATRLLLVGVGVGLLVLAGRQLMGTRDLARLVDAPDVRATDPTDPNADAAVQAALAAARAAPEDAAARFAVGAALGEAGRYAEAAEAFREALVLQPGNASILRNLGIVESRAGQDARAIGHLEAALAHDPEDPLVRLLLGWSTLRAGSPTGAAVHARALLEARPGQPDARYLLAYAAFVVGDVRTALVEVEALLAEHPDHTKARLLHAVLAE